jgi:DNA modification methylase
MGTTSLSQLGSEKQTFPAGAKFDLVFTSPPYFDREKYFEERGQCWLDHPTESDWFKNYLIPTLTTARDHLADDGKIVLNVDDVRRHLIIDAADKLGLKLVDELKLSIGRDHFSRKAGIQDAKTEPILIFSR